MKNTILTYIVLLTSIFSLGLYAQMEERGLTREGNQLVKDSLYVLAEAEYLKSLDIQDFDTNRFNMAFAMLGQEKVDEAIEEWESVEKSSDNKLLKSFCAYNIGGVMLMQEKTDEALEQYKQALRYFPKNEAARHNYWLLKLMKDQNPQQQQQNKDQQNKDQQDKNDQDNSENQDSENTSDSDDSEKSHEDEDEEKSREDEDADKSNKDEDADKSNEDEDADESNEDEDADESNEDEDADESNEDEDADKSNEDEDADKSNEDEDADKSNDGDSEDEKEGDEEGESYGEDVKEGELSTGDALRLLESLDKEEDKTQEKVKAKLLKGKKRKKHEKDW